MKRIERRQLCLVKEINRCHAKRIGVVDTRMKRGNLRRGSARGKSRLADTDNTTQDNPGIHNEVEACSAKT